MSSAWNWLFLKWHHIFMCVGSKRKSLSETNPASTPNAMSETSLKLLIADSQPIFINGLQQAIDSNSIGLTFEIISVVHTASELLKAIEVVTPDLLLLDINLPDMDGLELLQTMKESSFSARILVMSIYEEPKVLKTLFRCGVDGYVLKRCQPEELVQAIQTVMIGETYVAQGLSLTNVSGLNSRMIKDGRLCDSFEQKFAKRYQLTHRELEVLKLIGQAKSNKEIGGDLYISDQTVSVHRKNIMRKTGVNNTANLIRLVYEYNLV